MPPSDDSTITSGDDLITSAKLAGDPMKFLLPLGRLLFSLIFISAAPRHFTHEGIQHAAALGVPAAGALVPFSGLLAIVGGLSVAAGYKTRWGAWLLVAFLVPVTCWMHGFWRLNDPATIHIQQAMFGKNLSILGAALLISQFGSGSSSVDERNRRLNTASERHDTADRSAEN
jgi:putative oxidoreductase